MTDAPSTMSKKRTTMTLCVRPIFSASGMNSKLPILLRRLCILLLPALGLIFLAGCSAQRVNVPELRLANAEKELPVIRALPSSPGGPVTLQEAVNYALAHNLETKIREIEQAVQEEFITGKKMEMLPSLMAQFSLSGRSDNPAIRAEDADTGHESLPPSYFSDQFTDRARVYLAWDLLDFGVTYFRSRQALNRLAIMEEKTKQAKQQLVREVTRAYGHALVAQEALESARSIMAEHNARLARARDVDQADLKAVNLSLEREIDSLESIEEISRYERAYNAAQTELSRLMGLAPGSRVELVKINTSMLPPALNVDVRKWEREAVLNRAELSEKDIQEKITEDEANIAFARMFPNPGLILGFQRDGNSFLTVNDWFSVGLTVSWNLLSIPRRLSEKRQAELEGKVLGLKRMSVTMAVMAQVNMAALEYQDSIKRYLLKEDIAARRDRLVQGLGRDPDVDPDRLLEEKTDALNARIDGLQAYMEILEARETVYASLGRDPYEDRGYGSIQTSVNPPLMPAMRHELRPDASATDVPPMDGPTMNGPALEEQAMGEPVTKAPAAEIQDLEERILRENSVSPEEPDSIQEMFEDDSASRTQPQTGDVPTPLSPTPEPSSAPAEPMEKMTPAPLRASAEAPRPTAYSTPSHARIIPATDTYEGEPVPLLQRKRRGFTPAPEPVAPTVPAVQSPAVTFSTPLSAPAMPMSPSAPSAPAQAAGQVETRIFYEPGTGPGKVRITSGGPVEVTGYVHLSDPERLVVNLKGTGPWHGPSNLPARGGLSGIRVQTRPSGMRLILELAPGTAPEPAFENTPQGMSIVLKKG